jgi:hypothetical protein
MNKIELAAHFGISRQRLHQLIRSGHIRQDASGEWIRVPALPGRRAKRRQSYAAIADQLGYCIQTVARMDRRGRLVDTGEGWDIIELSSKPIDSK